MLTQVFPEPAEDDEIDTSLYTSFKVEMTPRLAAAFLRRLSIHQRMRDNNKVDSMAAAILDGVWEDNNADPIKIGINGDLTNGQHRLQAVLRSGVTVQMWMQLESRQALF